MREQYRDSRTGKSFPYPPRGDHTDCRFCDGSGWKEIMLGAQVLTMPCNGPSPRGGDGK